MKGGREDVDTSFWSWDTWHSGTCWHKWPRESLSLQKITYSEKWLSRGSGLDSHWLRRRGVSNSNCSRDNFCFWSTLNFTKVNKLWLKYMEICWNIFGHNFARGGTNDLIFWIHSLNQNLRMPYFLKQWILTLPRFHPPRPFPPGESQTRQSFFLLLRNEEE